MIYKLLSTEDGVNIFARIDDDGLCRVTCTENNPDFQAYIQSGAELLDSDGQVLDAIQFVKELP